MASQDPLDLARIALGRLASLTTQVGVTTGKPICGTLGGHLCCTAHIVDSESVEEALRGKVEQLLRNAEKLCNIPRKWPSKPDKYRHSLLEGLAAEATTSQFSQARSKIKHNLTELIQGKHGEPACRSMIEYLGKFNEKYGLTGRGDAVETKKKPGGIYEYPPEVKASAYRVLQEHMACCRCSHTASASNFHSTHLLLRPPSGDGTRLDEIQFDILFSSKVPQHAASDVWQQVQLFIPRTKKGKKSTRFERGETKPSKRPALTPLPPGKFCEMIVNKTNACLQLMVQGNALHKYGFQPLERIVEDYPSITLASLLRRFRLPARTKVTLAYILASSLWQFYDSDWMNVRWTSSTVSFVKERQLQDATGQVFAWKPYLTAKFGERDVDAAEASDLDEIHLFPRVRALGVMLIEIVRGEPISPKAEERKRINGEYWIYMNAIEDRKLWTDVDYPDYKEAVRSCFDGELFDDAPYDSALTEAEQKENLKRRRDILYDKIVFPLEDLLTSTKWMDQLTSIGPLDTRKRQSTAEIKMIRSPVQDLKPGDAQLKSAKHTLTPSQQEAKHWLEEMDLFNEDLTRVAPSALASMSASKPIRIAVLDTGCDDESTFFDSPRNFDRLKGWKDFAAGSEEYRDTHGHGTFLVSLIMRIAPEAHIYVARVAEDPVRLVSSGAKVAEAISWASREWKADVISMSFGYLSEQLEISKAIRGAIWERDNSVLFFAAASNSGANEPEMWPARHESVISMRGTSYKGEFQEFNPARARNEDSVFGTLGLDVPSAGLRDCETKVFKKGSSVATAVAAAMAAVMLQYVARKVGGGTTVDEVDRKLRTRQGMQAMFYDLSRRTTKERYLYVNLWKLRGIEDEKRWAIFLSAMAEV